MRASPACAHAVTSRLVSPVPTGLRAAVSMSAFARCCSVRASSCVASPLIDTREQALPQSPPWHCRPGRVLRTRNSSSSSPNSCCPSVPGHGHMQVTFCTSRVLRSLRRSKSSSKRESMSRGTSCSGDVSSPARHCSHIPIASSNKSAAPGPGLRATSGIRDVWTSVSADTIVATPSGNAMTKSLAASCARNLSPCSSRSVAKLNGS